MNNNTLTFLPGKYLNLPLTCKHDQQHNNWQTSHYGKYTLAWEQNWQKLNTTNVLAITLAITHKAASELAIAVRELTVQWKSY